MELKWGHKHRKNCLGCCAPKVSKGLGLVQCVPRSPCVPLSQKRRLILVSLDVYLASCLSICLSFSVTVKGQKKKKKKAQGWKHFASYKKNSLQPALWSKVFFLWSRNGLDPISSWPVSQNLAYGFPSSQHTVHCVF